MWNITDLHSKTAICVHYKSETVVLTHFQLKSRIDMSHQQIYNFVLSMYGIPLTPDLNTKLDDLRGVNCGG